MLKPIAGSALLAISMVSLSPVMAQTSVPASSETGTHQQDARTIYEHKLTLQCAAKHLDQLAPAELADVIENFTQTLTPDQQRSVRASMEQGCVGVAAGATCSNVGFMEAAISMNKMDAFVTQVCTHTKR